MKYEVLHTDKTIIKELIIKNHYTHKWSACRYTFGLYKYGDLVGAAVYGFPVGRQVVGSISPILHNMNVLELTRLWIADTEGKNTESYTLGQTFRKLRELSKHIWVLIAYSDPMFGHIGGIYQATNWLYQGNNTMLIKGYTHVVNGEHLHPRTCVAKYGTIKVEHLKTIDSEYYRIPMEKKHRYIYLLSKANRGRILKSLKHEILPYPKLRNEIL